MDLILWRMFYSQAENIRFRLFYPRLKVVSEKHWLCHWSEWNFIHYRSDSSFKYTSNVPCHGLIHSRPASKLCLLGWICRLSLSLAFYGWCFDQKMSEFSTMFQNREEKTHFSIMTSWCLVMKSRHHYRIRAVQSRWSVGTRGKIFCTVVPNAISVPK